MNRLINKLERKFGKYAISNLAVYIIGAYVIGYVFQIFNPDIMDALTLNPYRIFHGEVWRLVTWLLAPPDSLGIFTIIMLMFYYSLARHLEGTWGTFRFNLYIFSGIIMTVIGALLLYLVLELTAMRDPIAYFEGITGLSQSNWLDLDEFDSVSTVNGLKNLYYQNMFSSFSTYYINLSIFLAFAACYPDMQIMLYFIIPLKIKWLAYLDVAVLAYSMILYAKSGNWAGIVIIIVSLLNFILFFFGTRDFHRISPGEVRRKRNYSRQVHQAQRITKHKCAICGRTDEDGDYLQFRFCSKCNGNYEYCQDHIFTHEHIK